MSPRILATVAAIALMFTGAAAVPAASASPTAPSVVAAASGAVAESAGPAAFRLKFFQTPSGNIRCGMFKSGGKWSMRCDVYDHSWVAPGPNPCGGTGDYGSSVGMGGKGRAKFICVSDAMDSGRTLTYGTSLTYGPFFCKSRPKGLKCYNGRGHGWFLSRESYRLF